MTVLSDVLSSTIVGRLGWTLLYSVWQFACIAVVLWAVLTVLRRRSANARYLAACLALLATLASSAVTFHLVRRVAAPRVSLTVAGKPGTALVTERAGREAIHRLREGPRARLRVVPPTDSQRQRVLSLPPAEAEVTGEATGADGQSEAAAAAMPSTIADVLTPWLSWVSLVWISGVVVLSCRHLSGWIGVQRLRHVGTRPVSGELARLVRALSARMKVSRPVRVLQSTLVEIPIVAGWLRPVILLPASLITGLSVSQLEAILAHELAHVRRHDYLVNLLQTVAETLLFYHPGVWWISRQIRLEREHCCDDAAVGACGSKTALAEALTEIEASRLAVEPVLAATGNRFSFTLRRVRRLLDPKARSAGPPQAAAAAVVALALLGIVLTVGFVTLASAGDNRQGIHSADTTRDAAVSPEYNASVAVEPETVLPEVEKLLSQLVDRREHVRRQAVEDLWRKSSSHIDAALRERLSIESDSQIRLALRKAMALRGDLEQAQGIYREFRQGAGYGWVLDDLFMRPYGNQRDLWDRFFRYHPPEQLRELLNTRRARESHDPGAWNAFKAAVRTLQHEGDRVKAAELFHAVQRDFPDSFYAPQARGLSEQLRKMVAEDHQWQEPGDVASLDAEQKIAYHVYHLRDVFARQFSDPGSVSVFAPQPDGAVNPAVELRELGEAATAALLALLEDRRPIRAVGHRRTFDRDPQVLRYQDAAVEILNALLPERFYRPNRSGAYLSNEPAELRAEMIAWLRAYWKDAADEDPVQRKWIAVRRGAGIYQSLRLLESLAAEAGRREEALAELRGMYGRRHWAYRPKIALKMAELGDCSKVAEVLREADRGRYVEGTTVWLPDDGCALANAAEDVKRLRKLSGAATPLNPESTRGKAVEAEIVARQAEADRQSKPLVVDLIHAEGNLRETPSFWIGYEQLNEEALRERATRLLEASPGLEVVVRADRTMKHEHVAELLELLKAVGAKNVSLAVFPLGSVFAIDPGPGRDGTIRGKVIAPHHRARPVNYVVMLDHEAWANQLGEPPSLEVAAGETFEFRNVPAGKCEVRARPVTASGRNGGLPANTAEVEVIVQNKQVVEVELSFDQSQASSAWGEAVDGLQCRLLPAKSTWKAGETPQLQADLRNRGKSEWLMGLYPTSWEVQYDGVWYHATARFSGGVELLRLKPGDRRSGISLLLEDRFEWMSKEDNRRLVFRPGKHTLRAAFHLHSDDGHGLRVVSNPAEIEVLLDEEESYVEFGGRVVDDETGEPVERFGLQWGLPYTAGSNEIGWGGITMHAQSRRDGKFHERIGWGKGNHAGLRILADGYLPQAVTPQAAVSPARRTGLVVRLKRGLEVRGRVVDPAGKPVADAIVCLGGNQMVNFVDGRLEYFSGSRTTTGKDGRFVLQGAATEKNAEKKSCLLVSAKSVHVWRASLPEPGKEAEITLPEPATLKIRYDVPGGEDPGQFRLHLKTWEMEAWKGVVESLQKPTAQNGGQIVLKNLPPGVYDLSRTKQIRVGQFGQGAFCGRRDVDLEAGKTVEVRFVRKTGYPITGQVIGLKGTGVVGGFIFVRPAGAGGDPRNRDGWKLDTFDALSCDVEGRFKTETIPPGDYHVVAQAYHPMDRNGPMSTGERLPDLIGTAKVTVSPDGPPAAVRIEVRPREERTVPPMALRPSLTFEPVIERVVTEQSTRDGDLSPQELQQRRATGRGSPRTAGHQEPFVLVLDGKRFLAGRIMSPVSSPMFPAINYAPPNTPVMVHLLEKDKKAFLDVLRREGKAI